MIKKAFVPAPVTLVDTISGAPRAKELGGPVVFTFAIYALVHWLNDKKFVNPFSNLDIMLRLKKEFLKEAGQEMQFQDQDLQFLAKIVENPSADRELPLVQEQLVHFDKLILDLAASSSSKKSK
jgi:hypothetical protein